MNIFLPFFSLVLSINFCLLANAQEIHRPKTISELGHTLQQKAYRVKGRVVWMDVGALRRDFPELQMISELQIEKWILSNFSYVTKAQLDLSGTVITSMKADMNQSRFVYHPFEYMRASIVPFVTHDPDQPIGLVDLKGNGYGPQGLETISEFFDPIKKLREPSQIDSLDIHYFETARKEAIQDLRELQETQSVGTERSPASLEHHIELIKLDIEIYGFLIKLYNRALSGKKISKAEIREYVNILGKRDYTNGVAPLSRLLKEIIVQKISQRLMDEYNLKKGTHFSTIDHYFLIQLPFRCDSPGGQKQAVGILGRQAHWRFKNIKEITFPRDLPIKDTLGREQASVFGSLVDFENITVEDARVSMFFGVSQRSVDIITKKITNRLYLSKRKIKEIIEEVVSKIPESSPSSNDDYNEAISTFVRARSSAEALFIDESVVKRIIVLSKDPDNLGVLIAVLAVLASKNPEIWNDVVQKLLKNNFKEIGLILSLTTFSLLHSRSDIYTKLLHQLGEKFRNGRTNYTWDELSNDESFFTDLRFLRAKLISISSNELVRREAYRLGVDITNFWTRFVLHIHSMLTLYTINHPKLPIGFLFSDINLNLNLNLLSEKIDKESIITSFAHAKKIIKGNALEAPPAVSGFRRGKCHFSFVPKF